jgi:hypothetical protein
MGGSGVLGKSEFVCLECNTETLESTATMGRISFVLKAD